MIYKADYAMHPNGVFDCHLHIKKGLDGYPLPLLGGNVIFNTIDEYQKEAPNYPGFYHTLIFDFTKPTCFYDELVHNKRIVALKIHSRLQKIGSNNYEGIISAIGEISSNIPIIYDAFYYGGDLDHQPNLCGLIKMIKAFPNRKFVVAHSGGYQVLKYFFHLKEFANVGFDLSFSLQYLSDTSCRADLLKLIRHIPNERIFFGSDYPEANPALQANVLNTLANELELQQAARDGMFMENWELFLGLKKEVSV